MSIETPLPSTAPTSLESPLWPPLRPITPNPCLCCIFSPSYFPSAVGLDTHRDQENQTLNCNAVSNSGHRGALHVTESYSSVPLGKYGQVNQLFSVIKIGNGQVNQLFSMINCPWTHFWLGTCTQQ